MLAYKCTYILIFLILYQLYSHKTIILSSLNIKKNNFHHYQFQHTLTEYVYAYKIYSFWTIIVNLYYPNKQIAFIHLSE